MSTIGRIFVVLNLLLSGGFLYFAGVHLTNETDFRQQLEQEREDRAERESTLESNLSDTTQKLNNKTNQLTALEGQLNRANSENATLTEANARLDSTLNSIQGEVMDMASNWNQIQTKMSDLESRLQDALKDALAASTERNDAVRAKSEAESDRADLEQSLSELRRDFEERTGDYEDAIQTIQEKDLLIEALQSRMVANGVEPIVPNLIPALSGSVIRVENSGNYLTIRVAEGEEEVKVGYTFSIASGGRLKAVARVSEVYSNGAAFCTYRTVSGSAGPEVGDEAFTRR